jgi:Tfp pilus assembly protein PilN
MLHNLLPPSDKKAIRTEYLMRLGTVAASLATAAVLAGGLTLVPIFFTTQFNLTDLQSEMITDLPDTKQQTASVSTVDDQQVLNNLTYTLTQFEDLLQEMRSTDVIRAAFDARTDAVVLSGVAFDTDTPVLRLEGTASTRDALVEYARTLEDSPFFGRVPLTISDLARSTDIRFNLTLPLEVTKPTRTP